MSLAPIRTYFADRLLELDSDYTEHDDAFNVDNIGAQVFDKAYHVSYSSVRAGPLSMNTTLDRVEAQVLLFRKGFRDPQDAVDQGMDFANSFRLRCMRPAFANSGINSFIKGVTCTGFSAEPVATNDNAVILRLNFDVLVTFGTSDTLNC